MKMFLALILSAVSFSVLANPRLEDITKKDVEEVSREFGTNFAHTTVAAPETDGLWGVEVGVIGGQTDSPEFKGVVNRSGGDGSDFEKVYHAGLMARAHFPYEIFAELSVLPEQEISDVTVKTNSFGVGWNAGGFFNLPVDVAIGFDYAKGNVSFKQEEDIAASQPAANIDLETKTKVYWLGISKTFAFFTPYFKFGRSTIDGDLNASASYIFLSDKTSEKVSVDGTFYTIGANIQLLILRLGVEATQMQDVKRVSGKVSFAF